MDYLRPLFTKPLAKSFVQGVLEIKDLDEVSDAVNRIIKAEMQLSKIGNGSTLKSSDYRDIKYPEDEDRYQLRIEIFEELIKKKRLPNDDKIKKGKGGALPLTKLLSEKQAIIVIGLPASGKSTISSIIADTYGAVILDSDFAKRKFPEFGDEFGASLVHDESSIVVFGDENNVDAPNVKGYCISQNYNVVIPKIGNEQESLLELVNFFGHYNYDVHLVLISLDRKQATKRAYERFLQTNRYVPLSLIFDLYSNDPILTYYRIRNNDCFKSFGKISTAKSKPIFIEGSESSPVNIFKN